MGKALEWLGDERCAQIASEMLTEPRQHGGEIWAHCPFHSEGSPGNAFSYSPEKDKAYCNSCGAGGDLISIYAAINGLDHRAAFIEFRDKYAPDQAGTYRKPKLRTPKPPSQSKGPERQDKPGKRIQSPAEVWQEKATAVLQKSQEALLTNSARLKWLADRGLDKRSAARFGLGWIDHDIFRPRESWGLETITKENGQAKKLWIPAGLVIPCLDGDKILRLRIRRSEGEPKYYVVPGSAWSPAPMLTISGQWSGPHRAVVVCEAELDAMLIAQEAGDLVDVLASGSATARPQDVKSRAMLRSAAWIGLWMDRDEAGDKGVDAWTRSETRARDIRPAGSGKMDPSDCHTSGLGVRDHILKSLPPAWRIALRGKDKREGSHTEGRTVLTGSEKGARVPDAVLEFGRLLESAPIVCVSSPERIGIKAVCFDRGQWVEDYQWAFNNQSMADRIWHLFWHDDAVFEYISRHPASGTGVNGNNFWDGLSAEERVAIQ